MFIFFAKNRLNYHSGQIFPFLIAVLCIVIIMVFITVNLGRLSEFKIDTSNAADAAALALASSLSGTLLGLGLKSDMMCGQAIVTLIFIIINCIYYRWDTAIMQYISHLFRMVTALEEARDTVHVEWGSAKKTAIQYAFGNIGVDEPRPTFDASGCGSYQEYLKGDSCGRSGFAEFMKTKEYWKDSFGDIGPKNIVDYRLTVGYGWDDPAGGGRANNCYHQGDCRHHNSSTAYQNYDNWVEVEVMGGPTYTLTFWSFLDMVMVLPMCLIAWLVDQISLPNWLAWLDTVIDCAVEWYLKITMPFLYYMDYIYPTGLDFSDHDQTRQTDDLILTVNTARHRSGKNTGLWNFQYGTVESSAFSRVFREDGCRFIHPVLFPIQDCDVQTEVTASDPCSWITKQIDDFIKDFDMERWFDTRLHLYETELIGVR